MTYGKEYLESLGLEIAKKKYYNAAKVESVIGDFSRRTAALEEENAALRARAEEFTGGREEIGEAILSAKAISQRMIAESREQADALLADARAEAEKKLAEADVRAEELLAEARVRAEALERETEEKLRAREAACAEREQRTIRGAQESYLQLREECLGAVRVLDGAWQRFLCSLGEEDADAESGARTLPEDMADKLGALAECLRELDAEPEDEQGGEQTEE